MLLIVLVFSLVALERRTELGISRALGARRRDVILLLAVEGGLYSLISSLFGLGAGLALALGIIRLAQGLVEQYGFHLEPVIQPASIAASYGLSVVLTFLAVTVTAWRSSRFSVVTAIRDLPDPVGGPPGWPALALGLALAVAGPLLVGLAVAHRLSLAYAVGVALGIVGLALVARWLLLRMGLRGPERVVFTLAGVALIGWWVLPISLFPPVVEMSFLSGVTMLLGSVWVLAYNVGLLRRVRARAALWLASRTVLDVAGAAPTAVWWMLPVKPPNSAPARWRSSRFQPPPARSRNLRIPADGKRRGREARGRGNRHLEQ